MIEVEYIAGNSAIVFDLALIESYFQIDPEHKSYCEPIVFEYQAVVKGEEITALDSD